MNSVLQRYNILRQGLPTEASGLWSELMPGRLESAEPKGFQDHDQLLECLGSYGVQQGWLCCQSRVIRFNPGERLPEDYTDSGWILYGEMVVNKDSSLHIRQDGQGGWLVTEIAHISKETDGLIEQVQFIAMPVGSASATDDKEDLVLSRQVDRLAYQRYWRFDPDYGYRKAAARFTGFINTDSDRRGG